MDPKNSYEERSKIGLETNIVELLKREKEKISGRLYNVLLTAHFDKNYCGRRIKTIKDLVTLTKTEIYRIQNFGEKTLQELNSVLERYQLPTIDINMRVKHYNRSKQGLWF